MTKAFNATPLVSVVVPVYNNHGHVVSCVEAIRQQTYPKIELILVNDGSTDGSAEIIDRLAEQDAYIKAFHSDNRGPSAARNIGLNAVSGEFVFFADCDDILHKDGVAHLMGAQQQYDLDVVLGDFIICRSGQPPVHPPYLLDHDVPLFSDKGMGDLLSKYLLRPTGYALFTSAWAKLFRSRTLLRNHIRFDESSRVYEDTAFVIESLTRSQRHGYVRQHIYTYFANSAASGSASALYKDPQSYKVVIRKARQLPQHFSGINDNLIANAHVQFALRTLIRLAKGASHFGQGYGSTRTIMADPELWADLVHYIPFDGDSRVVPFCVGVKWPLLCTAFLRWFKQ